MRRFKSEFAHSYSTYSFGYSEYAERESQDTLGDIYACGFLPYSGTEDIINTLYMARSARVDLETFAPNSENRRITRKFDGAFTRTRTPIDAFDTDDSNFQAFCLNYFAERHGAHVMPKKRFDTILNAGFITDIITYANDDTIVGYVFVVADDTMEHYWFSFYDLELTQQSLGLWIMLDCISQAQLDNKKHYYVGTVYGTKALYKTNFPGLEWWNGNEWIRDTKLLRTISKQRDPEHTFDIHDMWKEDHKLF